MSKHKDDYSKELDNLFLEAEDRRRAEERADLLEEVVRASGGTKTLAEVEWYRDLLCENAKGSGVASDTECQAFADAELRDLIANEPALLSSPGWTFRTFPVWYDEKRKCRNAQPAVSPELVYRVQKLKADYTPERRAETETALFKLAKPAGCKTDGQCAAFVKLVLQQFEQNYAERLSESNVPNGNREEE